MLEQAENTKTVVITVFCVFIKWNRGMEDIKKTQMRPLDMKTSNVCGDKYTGWD